MELEEARKFAELGPNQLDADDDLTIAELMDAVSRMKNETAGPDSIPTEIFKNSTLENHELFFFLRQVWRHECVPKNLVLCMFVMIYKRK